MSKCFCGSYLSLTVFDSEVQLNIPGGAFFGGLRLIHRRRAETPAHGRSLSLAPSETLRFVSLPHGDFQTVAAVTITSNGQIAIIPLTPGQMVKTLKRIGRPRSPFRIRFAHQVFHNQDTFRQSLSTGQGCVFPCSSGLLHTFVNGRVIFFL